MDLHLHTPASVDYREANVTYLALLKKAEERGLDIIAFTDHNTVAGYERFLNEVESLELLERLNRLTDSERTQLAEYRRLQDKLLVLPGFELTATLGFHILGIFPPETSVRELEHLLLDLRVPPDKLDLGSGEVGATSDVLTAYRLIDEAGGLAIAAHSNSSHGVAMPGFDFGGQTRVSYTQDSHLHALEVTDLTSKSRRRTALFFSGTKPEYPRRMHLIQSSDAHRLTGISGNNQELGVGDRATEILLDELALEAIKEVFLGNDFARVRPYEPTETQVYDPILQAREDGDTLVQAFHEHFARGRGIERGIIQDVVALANTNGGTIYIGLSANPRSQIVGVQRPSEAIHQLKLEMAKHIVPPLEAQLDSQKIGNRSVIRIIVPRGSEVPYALDGTQIYVRSENETSLAVRDEIVNLVRDVLAVELAARPEEEVPLETGAPPELPPEPVAPLELPAPPPRTGVQVIPAEKRRGETQYSVRDLRNNRLIHNVTRSSARKLWQYAISEFEEHPIVPAKVKWLGDLGLSSAHKRAGKVRYDLLQRDTAGHLHIYYGVTEDGIHGPWKALIEREGGEPTEIAEVEETERAEAPEFVQTQELPPIADMGLWIEQGPSTPAQEAPEPVQADTIRAQMEEVAGAVTASSSPGFAQAGEASDAQRPLEISEDNAKMGLPLASEEAGPGGSATGEAAGEVPVKTPAGTHADVASTDQVPNPAPESKDEPKGAE
jgi:schlafen family protein/PHP domain-containing protein